MYKFISVIVLFAISFAAYSQSPNWKPAGGKLSTPWASQVNPVSVLNDYPRPQMERSQWQCLNGLWDYIVLPKTEGTDFPKNWKGKILVPFAIESSLSGVGETVGKDSVLWYRQSIKVSKERKGKKTLLHFGAVDWQADVYVNGNHAGMHQGGYDPFYFDITAYLLKGEEQEIVVKVWDPSDEGPQPRGKQVRNPRGIWYTPVTGIWQTVWMEMVPETFITATLQTPDIDARTITAQASVVNFNPTTDKLRITILDGGKVVGTEFTTPGKAISIPVSHMRLWSPEDPHLYDLTVAVLRKDKVVDEVKTYFAMRKISMGKDNSGIQRMLLNNEFVFQYGPLDQGWWPDGLYTAPTDEALKFDIVKTKEMGFNMIRKHVKAEPARWYHHCDKLGMLVWQDMPSGDMGNRWDSRPGIFGRATEKERSAESEAIFKKEWNAIMESLYNFPSIVVWVPFNEAWGQFKTKEIVQWNMDKDPSRLVNTASGGNFEEIGQIMDLHNYPEPAMPDPKLWGKERILVLGEFGGLGLPLENHTWQEKDNWGYQSFKNMEELEKRYSEFIGRIPEMIRMGLSAAVYTQTTDVEIETNGVMTYDRKIIKIAPERLRQIHDQLYRVNIK